ncbi:MAG: hypothetical protein JWN13_6925 [Betaproteobacteria bacterium]|jgi:hypothetical protein|nr:hypothetical protein [Betaproteobacteria bacterium]MEA3156316.1 hypothetical protein [Betaproteobacteria bacterium]
MNSHELPAALSGHDRKRIEKQVADLRQSANGSGTISVFLPTTRQVIILVARDGDVVSWCLMPARDQGSAHKLKALLEHVLKRELESACRDVKAIADAAIGRASRIA